MALPTLDKCCCCEIRWGALIVGIMRFLVYAYVLGRVFIMETENDLQELGLYIVITIRTLFLASSILIIVSVWVPKKQLPCVYLILAPIEEFMEMIILIYICTKLDFEDVEGIVTKATVWIMFLALDVYFWFVIYSWYKQIASPSQS
ncbi:uncharacterized protein Dana_GF28142, isoform B [Drosophila ananassae]|uniref:Uncharacterized protein, isoform B n=1 Tax=Drosophila ananassae TaxID=7217 RepID=A0A0P8Y3C8_DROAN|nr:uncharacterized protein LOC6495808 isoform X2 [Drosophila ananassae]KPU76224.1 uncharacterized protein Dana_GF28142, isoform B [Drosophila ananassae]